MVHNEYRNFLKGHHFKVALRHLKFLPIFGIFQGSSIGLLAPFNGPKAEVDICIHLLLSKILDHQNRSESIGILGFSILKVFLKEKPLFLGQREFLFFDLALNFLAKYQSCIQVSFPGGLKLDPQLELTFYVLRWSDNENST